MAEILEPARWQNVLVDKAHHDAVYMDNRRLDTITSNGQHFVVSRIYWGISGICLLRITRSAWLFLIRHI